MLYFYFDICRINVKLHLFTKEQGGRENRIDDGYRPDHSLSSDDKILTMGPVYFLDKTKTSMNTGEVAEMQVRFLVSPKNKSKLLALKQGDKWGIFEGSRCVGECEMVERITTEEELEDIVTE